MTSDDGTRIPAPEQPPDGAPPPQKAESRGHVSRSRIVVDPPDFVDLKPAQRDVVVAALSRLFADMLSDSRALARAHAAQAARLDDAHQEDTHRPADLPPDRESR